MPEFDLKKIVILGVLLIVVSLVSFIGGFYLNKPIQIPNTKPVVNKEMVKISPLFQNQTAMIQGKITKVDRNLVTITDHQNQSDTFPLSSSLIISKASTSRSPAASASSDIKAIELNKESNIILRLENNVFQIMSISYPSSNPPSTPAPTPIPKKTK